MKFNRSFHRRGFTLLETVIAIGVLAVLLTGFMVVFAPAAEGIRKSINVQQADRLATTLEQELVTLRDTEASQFKTGFGKAFNWIKESNAAGDAILVYQYRGEVGSSLRTDGTPIPVPNPKGKITGEHYVVVPMARRVSDTTGFDLDIQAIEGSIYLVKCTQLIFDNGELKLGTPGDIIDPKGTASAADPDSYPDAVIAFSADFYQMPARTQAYFSGSSFTTKFADLKNPVFSRNLAVGR